jgi:AcrR family transcriptional regulator
MSIHKTMSRTAIKAELADDRAPPRERILAAALDLFYRHGIRAVGVEAIAEAAGTNKMTLYRHFASKDELVAEYLRRLAGEMDAIWCELERKHPDDPRQQLVAWLRFVGENIGDPKSRGCAFANAAVELPEKDHPARCIIEKYKAGKRQQITRLCRKAGADKPETLADELFLLIEGALVCAQSLGANGPAPRLVRLGETIIKSHLN